MNKPFVFLCAAALLSMLGGCSSAPALHYYQLPVPNSAANSNAAGANLPDANAAVLVIEPVIVANYLNTNALILQTSAVQLVITKQHFWAEALDQQLSRLLLQQLQAALPDQRVTQLAPMSAHSRLLVQVEQFHGTEQGVALISGRYSILQGARVTERRFSLELPQPDAGYPALVQTLGDGWQQLSLQITAELKTLAAPAVQATP